MPSKPLHLKTTLFFTFIYSCFIYWTPLMGKAHVHLAYIILYSYEQFDHLFNSRNLLCVSYSLRILHKQHLPDALCQGPT